MGRYSLKAEQKDDVKIKRIVKTKKSGLSNLLLLLIILSIFVFAIISYITTSALFSNKVNSELDVDVAFYCIKEDYQQMNFNLGEIFPENHEKEYVFSVLNNKDGKRTETDLEYKLTLRLTTNLPLDFKFYEIKGSLEEEIKDMEIYQDEDGVFFKKYTLPLKEFSYKQDELHVYKVKLRLPEQYKSYIFSDRIDVLEITVDSKQKI